MKKVLFILKKRSEYSGYASGVSTGLLNSARFVANMLNQRPDMVTSIVAVTDNNDIDREVTAFKPTHVIIEALWVVPSKFDVLTKLHPRVQWVVRLHSEVPFLSNEGMAMGWIYDYLKKDNVSVGVNSKRFMDDLKKQLWWQDRKKVLYMPNYYPIADMKGVRGSGRGLQIDVGCFGAIRPLKNQLAQAMAAIEFANSINVRVNFHVNVGRVEMKGLPVLHNLESLFANSLGHTLVTHPWMEHPQFVELVRSMDICMQVSFSETFNIVAADSISNGVPTVMSPEIPWAKVGLASPTDITGMAKALRSAWTHRKINVYLNQAGLVSAVKAARKEWFELDWGHDHHHHHTLGRY